MHGTSPDAASATEELWNANQVAKVLGISATEVGRRLRRGEEPVPRYHAGEARNALWVPGMVRLYAAQRGQALVEHAEGRRQLPVPMWVNWPALAEPLPRVVDQVVEVPRMWTQSPGDPHLFHVRIWRGRVDGAERIVCLLSLMENATMYATSAGNGEWVMESVVAAGLLSREEAYRTFVFALGVRNPNHLSEDDPQSLMYVSFLLPGALPRLLDRWRKPRGELFEGSSVIPARLSHLAHLVGEEVEIYPDGTHTPEVVARYVGGERPVVVDWDPMGLEAHLKHTEVLRAWAAELTEAGQARDGATVTDAATTTANAVLLAHDYYGRVYGDERRDVVQRRVPQPDPATVEELRGFAFESGGSTVGHWLRLHRATVLLAARDGLPAERHAALLAAVAENAEMLSGPVQTIGTELGGWPLRLATAEHPQLDDYVQTLAWYGPKAEHQEAARQLREALWNEERDGLRAGYDPFDRLVLVTEDRTAATVACPAEEAAAYRLDQPHPGFHLLEDGRLDLLPLKQTGPVRRRLI
jgi:hypothetical protein